MPDKLSPEQFAARIKQRAPELRSVPDADLVRKVLDRRPDLITFLSAAPSLPPSPIPTPSFPARALERVGDVAESTYQIIPSFLRRGREEMQKSRQAGDVMGMATAPFRAEAGTLGEMAKGIGSVTTPVLAKRLATKEDPAKIIADVSLMMLPSGKPMEVTAKATAGMESSIIGAHTRAIEGFRQVEKAAGDVPVDPGPTLQWLQKAEELSHKGYTLPKPAGDLLRWVEEKSKPSLGKVAGEPGAKIDQPGTAFPLTVRDAREFYTALNEAIPWREEGYGGRNGRMYYVMDQARQALNKSTRESVAPYGLDKVLDQSMKDYARVARWRERSYGVGWLAGKIAGYGAGYAIGHPLMTGYVGGQAGESLAGSMVRSITEAKGTKAPEWPAEYRTAPQALTREGGGGANYTAADLAALKQRMGIKPERTGESAMEMERRRGPGTPPSAAAQVQRTLVDNLRMTFERQRATGDPQMWTTGERLRTAMDRLQEMEKGGR